MPYNHLHSASAVSSEIIGSRRVTVKRSFLGVSKCISRNGFQTDHLCGSLQKFLTFGDPQVKPWEVAGHSELFPHGMTPSQKDVQIGFGTSQAVNGCDSLQAHKLATLMQRAVSPFVHLLPPGSVRLLHVAGVDGGRIAMRS